MLTINLDESVPEIKGAEKSTSDISPRNLKSASKKQSVSSSPTLTKKKVTFQIPRRAADNSASDSLSQDSDSSQRLVHVQHFQAFIFFKVK